MRRRDAETDRLIDDLADVVTRPTGLEDGQAVIGGRPGSREAHLVDVPH